MRKLTIRQIDKLFSTQARGIYDSFIENSISVYSALFPEFCTSKTWSDYRYDMIRERLMVELQVLYAEAKGEKNVKNKCKKIKRAVAK
jgi:hypothetical protein